jgi:hypothetical protein
MRQAQTLGHLKCVGGSSPVKHLERRHTGSNRQPRCPLCMIGVIWAKDILSQWAVRLWSFQDNPWRGYIALTMAGRLAATTG